jgi:hypothetical protein
MSKNGRSVIQKLTVAASPYTMRRISKFAFGRYHLQTPTDTKLPDDVKAGDVFRYQFRGTTDVDWWDWGHIEDEHAETMVTLPCWRGRAVDPAGNGGRPELVVPASNPAEFRVVG